MSQLPDNPRAIGLPHPKWRASQRQAAQHILDRLDAAPTPISAQIVEGPTGTGKTVIAATIATQHRVTALVHTRALGRQYAKQYDFDLIEGRDAYECVHPEKVAKWARHSRVPTFAECHFEQPWECPYAAQCPYLVQRELALKSDKAVMTYPYYALSRRAQQRGGVLICDEVHGMPATLLDFTEFVCTEDRRLEYDLPPFPYSMGSYGPHGQGDLMTDTARKYVEGWIAQSMVRVGALTGMESIESARAKSFYARLARAHDNLTVGNWFLRSGSSALEEWGDGRKMRVPGLFLKALDPRTMTPRFQAGKSALVLMSATIGNPMALAHELGLDDFEFLSYPHPIPAQYRPIYDLGCPKMTAEELRQHPKAYQEQARRIANFILDLDPTWRGLVLTTSNEKIRILREELARVRGGKLQDRIYRPKYRASTPERVQGFMRDPRPGLISIDTIQGWGSGLDLRGDLGRFSIAAGVPHSNPKDAFENARKARVGGLTWQRQEAYTAVEQAPGRVQRGEVDESGEYVVSVGALADAGATGKIARSFYSPHFEGAIIKWAQ